MATEWNIAKSQRRCLCGREFEENETYFAALYEEGADFVRRDYCLDCWPGARERGGFFSFWKTTAAPKDQRRKLFADDQVLLDFFLRLENAQEEQHRHFFYILALILMRKKVLKFEDIERQEGRESLILRYPPEDRTFRVEDPRLGEDQIEALKDQLSEILDFRI